MTQTVFLLTISIGQVKRIKKINNSDFLVDPIPNHLTEDHKNCIADSKENRQNDFGSERINVRETPCFILGSLLSHAMMCVSRTSNVVNC